MTDDKNSLAALTYQPYENRSRPSWVDGRIEYDVIPDWEYNAEESATVSLFCDPERRMWLARVAGEFLEGYEQGQQVDLPFDKGPFTLNESACSKILDAYGIREETIDMDAVASTSPTELEKIAQNVK